MTVNTTENTPKHCHDCYKLTECEQAQFMNANTEPVDGFVWDGDYWCDNCLPDDIDDIDDQPQPLDYEEVDCPDHCGGCGIPLNCRLTTDGVEYVAKNMNDGCCRELWPVLFANYLEIKN